MMMVVVVVILPIRYPAKKESRTLWECTFYCFFFKTVITLKLKLQNATDEAVFMSTREHVLLEEVSRCSLYLRKILLQCPFNKTQFLQNMLDNFNIITTFPYLPTNAVLENKHTLLNKSNLPLGQCRVFLQEQYPNKI